MKIILNDGTEVSVQQVTPRGDYLDILSLEQPDKLYEYFSNPDKTKRIIVEERGQQTVYEGFTQFYRTETYTGGIYGVVIYKAEKTPEEKQLQLETELAEAKETIEMLTGCILEMSEAVYQ